MAKWGMIIDLDRCTACQACVTACQAENNLPPTGPRAAIQGRSYTWMEMIPFTGEGEHPKVLERLLPRPCLHCDNPPCVKVCPVEATFKNEEGIVGQVFSRCIGCRYCTTACPYTARYFNWHEPAWPEPMATHLNPDVSVRSKGVVEKCTLCHHRLQNARDRARSEKRPLRPGEYTPACVESCPTAAMVFGDLSNPNSKVAELAESRRALKLLEDLGTEPKVIYLREGD
ncbi:MAG: 4Fe-4S dicluster domain-containing protein [Planctomycetota bacterium]